MSAEKLFPMPSSQPGSLAIDSERAAVGERASRWIYQGIWLVLVRWFRVPDHPPTLPVGPGELVVSFRPAPGYLSYLKFLFWLVLVVIDGALLIVWAVIAIASPLAGALTALLFLAIIIIPDVIAYVAIHLRYDTMWYVLTPRSMRIRRGIWVIHETTITFENVQNVTVTQGPVQRYFGIANVRVDTAGGGGSSAGHDKGGQAQGHVGLLEGLDEAHRVRDLMLDRLQKSKSAGLGDEVHDEANLTTWTPAHLKMLAEVRDAAAALAGNR